MIRFRDEADRRRFLEDGPKLLYSQGVGYRIELAPDVEPKTPGQVAYEAHLAAVLARTSSPAGALLVQSVSPSWEKLMAKERECWEATAQAVLDQ